MPHNSRGLQKELVRKYCAEAESEIAKAGTREEALRLSALPQVRLVQPDRNHRMETDAGPKWLGADLIWNGASGGTVDVFRDGARITTTTNDGSYTDNIGKNLGGQSFKYKVCEAGTTTCSNESTVQF